MDAIRISEINQTIQDGRPGEWPTKSGVELRLDYSMVRRQSIDIYEIDLAVLRGRDEAIGGRVRRVGNKSCQSAVKSVAASQTIRGININEPMQGSTYLIEPEKITSIWAGTASIKDINLAAQGS